MRTRDALAARRRPAGDLGRLVDIMGGLVTVAVLTQAVKPSLAERVCEDVEQYAADAGVALIVGWYPVEVAVLAVRTRRAIIDATARSYAGRLRAGLAS